MRLIEIAKMSAEGVLEHWDEWVTEANKREDATKDPTIFRLLMIEFLSAEIEEQMTVAFNRGYKAAEAVARTQAESIDRSSDRKEAVAFNVVDVVEDQRGNEREKEFSPDE